MSPTTRAFKEALSSSSVVYFLCSPGVPGKDFSLVSVIVEGCPYFVVQRPDEEVCRNRPLKSQRHGDPARRSDTFNSLECLGEKEAFTRSGRFTAPLRSVLHSVIHNCTSIAESILQRILGGRAAGSFAAGERLHATWTPDARSLLL